MKPTNKKPSVTPKGFGFADAMFGIKDIAMQYEILQGHPNNPIPPPKQQPKNINKIQVIKKQAIKNETKIQKKIQVGNVKGKQAFKISAGKQFENFSSVMLLPIETTQNVFQLTHDGKESHWQYNLFCDGIEAKMIVEQPQVSFNFNAIDVRQGGLGNCYFISTLASLANLPKILRQRIPKYKSYSGKDKSFQVNLFQSGKCIKMTVDNLFPKIFVKPVLNDISLMILQKAYAQAYGNFEITNMGHSCDSLRDITGAPSEYIDFKNKQNLIADIKQAFAQQYPIVIASKSNVMMMFLSPKHSYNVLDYKIQNKNIYLKLRDPRSINCKQFPNIIHLQQQQRLNGIFWVDYKMLVDNFQVITISKVKQNNKYFYKTFKTKQLTNNQTCISFKLKQKTNITISCHQKHKKFFDQKFNYQMIRLLVAQIQNKNGKIIPVKTIASDFKVQQVCSITSQFDAGQYIIFSKIGQNNTKTKLQNQALTISFYTSISKPQNIQFQHIKGNIPIQQFLTNYIQNHLGQFKQSISDQKLYRYFGALYGYLCMYYQNKSSKSIIQQLQYNTQNITINQNKISLNPNQNKLIMHQIGQNNNCSHKFAFKTKTMYK